MSLKILVVDDEEIQREMLKGFLEKQGFQIITAANGTEALQLFSDLPLQLALLDHHMPDMTGVDVLARMKEINPQLRAIMITAFGAIETAVSVMKLGADDFMEKPVDLGILLEKIRKIDQELVVEEEAYQVNAVLDRENLPVRIVGSSIQILNLLSMVQRVAVSPWTVLIKGETGTGKELIGRLIHLLSGRSKGPFIEVNCAAIPESLFESELFGHEKGAFTGANHRKKGRFELADGGSLFLDEIGELPLNLQAKLLRALQEKRISRVGSEQDIPVDIRLIAATNRDLKQMVDYGTFREDLYYRLHVLEIEVPPLRQRKTDIPELVEYFLEKYSFRPVSFSSEAMAALLKYPFPGNIRELEHIVQRTVTLARSSVIGPEELPEEIRRVEFLGKSGGTLDESLVAMERHLIHGALEKNQWVQTRAAAELGISERVLRYKMMKLEIKKNSA
ncbi:MAG: sigma-54 dependent transcriptional regulator [Proteobacteria bacterium]|nr:sigma-54 dependent transcriptional regulator [Pseudomonadota bacterium]MBU1688980.1 sigma-54 dependent transcriptional regulator [Pseudomonadota bacterium]